MIDPRQLLTYVVTPVLGTLSLPSDVPDNTAAAQLLMGTAMQESELTWVHQISGPAIGLWQMEPATHDDMWTNFIPKPIGQALDYLCPRADARLMAGNLYYACAMARLFYYRIPEPLPKAGNIEAQAAYWKQYYNTPKGAGTVTQYKQHWDQMIGVMKGWA